MLKSALQAEEINKNRVYKENSKGVLVYGMRLKGYIGYQLANPNGVAAIVCFPGIFYRGGAEQKIRKYLIDNNYVDCIIQLPDNKISTRLLQIIGFSSTFL